MNFIGGKVFQTILQIVLALVPVFMRPPAVKPEDVESK